jgi:DNA-binding winged helix-turn-helix (wHTH) protein
MIYRFGPITLDLPARQVTRAGARVHLTRKAFELLHLLVQHRPAVVTKEDIHRHLWPTTFVSESSLQALISEIRQALDEDPAPSWIRTAHGVGYAFNGDVDEAPARPRPAVNTRAWLLAESWRVALGEGENVIGRGSDDVIVIDAPGISRRHARVVVSDGAVIEDLSSKNGTWVRDQRVTAPTPLNDGDMVRLGSLLFTFRFAHAVDSTDTQASPPRD